METIIKLRNPRILPKEYEVKLNHEEWCIRLSNINELYMADGKCYVIFSTDYYNMAEGGTVFNLCAEITVEEYDEIFDAINGRTVIKGEELFKHLNQ